MHTDVEWWTKIRLEVSREESSKREVLRREGIGWDTFKKILGKYTRVKEAVRELYVGSKRYSCR